MAENLKFNAPGSKCYDNLAENCETYGKFYNWIMAMNHCPDGWHLPDNGEWNTLKNYIGGNPGTKLKATSGWTDGNGTNDYGFAALPSGYVSTDNSFDRIGINAYWWSATLAYGYQGTYKYRELRGSSNDLIIGETNTSYYYSVRCVKGNPVLPVVERSSFVDERDSIRYNTVKIGVQTWMAENLKYNEPGSKCYNNDPGKCAKYGRLYTLEMATKGNSSEQNPSGVQGICPTGWHIPSIGEWTTLTNYIGNAEGMKLKATDGWDGYNNGLDSYGFTALPSGYVGSDNSFGEIGTNAYWWTATFYPNYQNGYKYRELNTGDGITNGGTNYSSNYFSVRCVEDIEMP